MKKRVKMKTLILIFVVTGSLAFGASSWVAKVDGNTIKQEDMDKIIQQQKLLAEIGNGRSLSAQFANKKFQKQVLELQIMQQLMVNEIKKINKQKHFISESEIAKNKANLSNQIEKALWLKAYTDKVLRPQVSVSQQAIDNFYEQNKSQFKNVTKSNASGFIKEELTLNQIQPLIMQLQNKVKSEANVTVNEKYFNE